MTDPNARKSGLTDRERIGVELTKVIDHTDVGQPNRYVSVELLRRARAILLDGDYSTLAAHSADARNGEGLAEFRAGLQYVVDCWEAAEVEGLAEALADAKYSAVDPVAARLADLVERRISYGIERAKELLAAPAAPAPKGEVVVTRNTAGAIVAVTRQDEEGRILSVIAEAATQAPAAQADERELDLYDEIECDLPALFGRASAEGHESGQALAAQLQAKMRKARQRPALSEEVEAVIACLGDDAAMLRDAGEHEEVAMNMDDAARLLEAVYSATPADAASEADKRDAERYQLIKRSGLILSGGYTKFGWLIAPFGDKCDKYLDAVLQRERQQGDQNGDN